MFILKYFRNRMAASVNYHQTRSLFLTHCTNSSKSHYETLGLTSQATQADIKRAFYRLSIQFHPDKRKGNEDKFKEVSTAYEVLGNPRLRRLYDRGIITHDDTDASINHPASHSGSDVSSEDQTEASKASVRSFDQWSKAHTSETFYRSQEDKAKRELLKQSKEHFSNQSGAENVFWIIGVIVFISAFVKFEFDKDKPSKKS